jgi:uncharacterized protein (DUF433 family)
MSINLEAIPVPLRDDGGGGYRVGQTRVSLDTVLHAHRRGESAEEIVRNFDTLQLADVYAVLAWAALHAEEADAYLKRREAEAIEIRRRGEALGIVPTPEESARLKQELIARKARKH